MESLIVVDSCALILQIIETMAIPVAIAIVGYFTTRAIKNRELNVKYVELSLEILKQPETENNKRLREWAEDTLNKYAEIEMPPLPKTPLVPDRDSFPGGALQLFIFDEEGNPVSANVYLSVDVHGVHTYMAGVSGSIVNLPISITDSSKGKFQITIEHKDFKPFVVDLDKLDNTRITLKKKAQD